MNDSCIPLTSLGMTQEKHLLLEELAKTSDYWLIAHALVRAAANLELSSLSDRQRSRLASIILELDCELYVKSWGIDKVGRPQKHTTEPESSFDKMRRLLHKENANAASIR